MSLLPVSLHGGWEGEFSETSGALIVCLPFPSKAEAPALCCCGKIHRGTHGGVWRMRVKWEMCELWSAFAFLLYYIVLLIATWMRGQLLVVGVFSCGLFWKWDLDNCLKQLEIMCRVLFKRRHLNSYYRGHFCSCYFLQGRRRSKCLPLLCFYAAIRAFSFSEIWDFLKAKV